MNEEKFEHRIDFERGHNCIDFECAFDKKACIPGKGESHGVHGMQIRFLVKGKKGVIQFLLMTDWVPQKIGKEAWENLPQKGRPLPADLGYHSYQPMYEGQSVSQEACPYLEEKPCYYDGSGLNAYEAYYTLINAGEEALWKFLEEYYRTVFYGEDFPKRGEYIKPIRETK